MPVTLTAWHTLSAPPFPQGLHVCWRPGPLDAQPLPPPPLLPQARGVIPERAGMAEDVLAEEALGEEMSFEELVGLKGPIMGLVENSLTVLACNMVLLAITVLLPFSLGRRACHVFAWLQRSPAARSAGAAVFAVRTLPARP